MFKILNNKFIGKKGLTLTELMVASILMGIVMIGIAGFSVAIKRMQDTTDKQAILAVQVAAAMAYMERIITQTYGSTVTEATDPSFDEDLAGPPNVYHSNRTDPLNTFLDSSDDLWHIFFSPVASPRDLYYCNKSYNPANAQPNGPNCNNSNRVPLLTNKLVSWTIQPVFDASPGVLAHRVDISITAKFNASNASNDPIDNPSYTMSTSVPLLSYGNNGNF